MDKGDGLEYLSEEGLDEFEGEATVVVLLDELVEGGAEGVEDEAEVAVVEE